MVFTKTENNSVTYETTNNPLVDLYFNFVRNLSIEQLNTLLNASYDFDPELTLKCLFLKRDILKGSGERKIFTDALFLLYKKSKNNPQLKKSLDYNLQFIPDLGRFSDLFCLYTFTDSVYKLINKQLNEDHLLLKENKPISLCAKWFPTEKSLRFPNFASDYCKKYNLTKRQLRKEIIGPLKKHLDLIETKLCNKDYDNIDFSKVPSKAINMYSKTFNKLPQFQEYISKVQKKEITVKTNCLYPHDIISKSEITELEEAQWLETSKKVKENNSLCICDVSGSMDGLPMDVCIALGLLISEKSAWKNKIVTFSSNPKIVTIEGKTLKEKKNNLKKIDWNMSTDLLKVFDLLLTQENVPEQLLIFSDMQFDEAIENNEKTTYKLIVDKSRLKGKKIPKIIFWNLRASKFGFSFPVVHTEMNCLLISGFDINLVNELLDNESMIPIDFITRILNKERYSKILFLGKKFSG